MNAFDATILLLGTDPTNMPIQKIVKQKIENYVNVHIGGLAT